MNLELQAQPSGEGSRTAMPGDASQKPTEPQGSGDQPRAGEQPVVGAIASAVAPAQTPQVR